MYRGLTGCNTDSIAEHNMLFRKIVYCEEKCTFYYKAVITLYNVYYFIIKIYVVSYHIKFRRIGNEHTKHAYVHHQL